MISGAPVRSVLINGGGDKCRPGLDCGSNGDYASVAYKGVDTVVDVGLARLGPAGGAASFAYDEIGGSKNLMWGARYAALTQAYMGMAQMCVGRGH